MDDNSELLKFQRSAAGSVSTANNTEAYNTNCFPVKPTRFPAGTPLESKRARKYYSELSDERQFLQHLRELWVDKLAALKEERKFLENMRNATVSDVEGVAPLFRPPDMIGLTEQPTLAASSTALNEGDETASQNRGKGRQESSVNLINDEPVAVDPHLLSVLAEVDRLFPKSEQTSSTPTPTNSQVELPTSSVENQTEEASMEHQSIEPAETDEQERNALKLFLEQFGDMQ